MLPISSFNCSHWRLEDLRPGCLWNPPSCAVSVPPNGQSSWWGTIMSAGAECAGRELAPEPVSSLSSENLLQLRLSQVSLPWLWYHPATYTPGMEISQGRQLNPKHGTNGWNAMTCARLLETLQTLNTLAGVCDLITEAHKVFAGMEDGSKGDGHHL